ncbi:MAG TPA: (d)CMP kinase [Solirubrobacteraceae bacterium]|nr:(d)CMP kinase [Solirubrobacteraceae bacterium]
MVIAIDGPAGAGKSTVARALARELGFAYLDTGAMYRCVALAALQRGDGELPSRPGAIAEIARAARIELAGTADHEGQRVLLDGRDVSAAIRAPEVSESASAVAADAGVREVLVGRQRELLAAGDWVADGRDVAGVLAPHAEVKVFLDADPHERARRRAVELGAELSTVLAEQTLRDTRDRTRALSPLAPAPGAVVIDTSAIGVEEVVRRIAEMARAAA